MFKVRDSFEGDAGVQIRVAHKRYSCVKCGCVIDRGEEHVVVRGACGVLQPNGRLHLSCGVDRRLLERVQ